MEIRSFPYWLIPVVIQLIFVLGILCVLWLWGVF